MIFGYGGYLVYRDSSLHHVGGGMTVGDLFIFIAYLGSSGARSEPSPASAPASGGAAGASACFEVLDREPGIADAPGAEPLPRRPRTLELRDVGFAYRDGRPARSRCLRCCGASR